MRRSIVFVSCVTASLVAACAKPVSLTIGLALPQSGALITGEMYTNSANLALKHINDAGGMRGRGQLVIVNAATNTTPDDAAAQLEKLVSQRALKAAIAVSSSEVLAIAPDGSFKGAGPAAAALHVPLLCVGCAAPDFECVGVQQAAFGALGTGGDPTCASTAGTIDRPGFVYRLLESSAVQGAVLAEMAAADGYRVAAGLGVDLLFGTAILDGSFRPAFSGTYVRTELHEQSAGTLATKLGKERVSDEEFADSVFRAYDAAVAPDATAGAVEALVVSSFPKTIEHIATARDASERKPAMYFSFTGYSPAVLASAGASLVGAKGVRYALAAGPSPGTFVVDYATAASAPLEQAKASAFIDVAYDAVMLVALAMYQTRVEDPTPEQVKQELDRLSDPNGDVIGYGDFQKAKRAIDAGRAVNYQGVSGDCDFSLTNGVTSPLSQWEIGTSSSGTPIYLE